MKFNEPEPTETPEYPRDVSTLMFVAKDLSERAHALAEVANSGMLDSAEDDAVTGIVASVRVRVALLQAMAKIYADMAHRERTMLDLVETRKMAPRHMPPPVQSKKQRELSKRLSALEVSQQGPPKAVKRPKDFMAQAVSFGLANGTKTAPMVRAWMIGHPKTFQLLLTKEPSVQRIAETLGDGSRGQNPRFIRVRLGWYKNNPKYKKEA